MDNCKEFQLDDLTAIVAVPVDNIYQAYYNMPSCPAYQLTPTISDFKPPLSGAITIGRQAISEDSDLIPIILHTGKAKDDESDAVSGRQHAVTVSCEVDDRDGEVWAPLLTLERSPRHLLLTFRGGTRAFVSATKDTYLCTVERNGAKTSVQFKIHNLMGIQLMMSYS